MKPPNKGHLWDEQLLRPTPPPVPTFKVTPPIFWPNLADSALARPFSGVQRLDLSLVQP